MRIKLANRRKIIVNDRGVNEVQIAEWRKQKGYTQQQLADALDVSQATVAKVERTNDPQLPAPPLMRRIWALTRGDVTPNDFYDLQAVGEPELALTRDEDAPLLLAASGRDQ